MGKQKTVAIMQPYFIPYTGYFRLLSQSDQFVIYDCVQFPRRGWVHRNKLVDANGVEDWVTLPLVKAPQDILIQDLEFPVDAAAMLAARLEPYPLPASDEALRKNVMTAVLDVRGSVVDYIASLLKLVANHLGITWSVVRSSSLDVPQSFRGQDRIIEIARRVGATAYLNAPGGVDLYDADAFAAAGMSLQFLPPYTGKGGSILPRLLNEDPAVMLSDMQAREAHYA